MPPCFTLANISLPFGPGTWWTCSRPRPPVQKPRQGSISSTISTGVSCFSIGAPRSGSGIAHGRESRVLPQQRELSDMIAVVLHHKSQETEHGSILDRHL